MNTIRDIVGRIRPEYTKDGIPECSLECPSRQGINCEIQGCKAHLLCRPGVAALAHALNNRRLLMDAYIRALAEVADGRENPVQFARTILSRGPEVLIPSEIQRNRENELP